jgi:hypothetical protein
VPADVYVLIQGDEPLIVPGMISAALRPLHEDPAVGCVNLAAPIRTAEELHDPNTIKVVTSQAGDALFMTRQPIPTQLGRAVDGAVLATASAAHLDERTWQAVYRQLLARGELATTEHGGLCLTERGTALLRGEGELRLGRRQALRRSEGRRSGDHQRSTRGGTATDAAALSGPDRALFDQLRSVRLELARAQGVPAYVVLDDAGLMALAQERPHDAAGLLRIPGIGPVKLERYGAALLAAIEHAGSEPAL